MSQQLCRVTALAIYSQANGSRSARPHLERIGNWFRESEHNEKQRACGSVNSSDDRKPGQAVPGSWALPLFACSIPNPLWVTRPADCHRWLRGQWRRWWHSHRPCGGTQYLPDPGQSHFRGATAALKYSPVFRSEEHTSEL